MINPQKSMANMAKANAFAGGSYCKFEKKSNPKTISHDMTCSFSREICREECSISRRKISKIGRGNLRLQPNCRFVQPIRLFGIIACVLKSKDSGLN